MQLTDNFYVDENRIIRLNTHKLVVRHYADTSMMVYSDVTYYVNDALYEDWTEQLIPKHALNELISENALDTTAYQWMDGIRLQTGDYSKEITEIASYGSLEAYQASQQNIQIEFALDVDYRLSKLELGI